MLRLGPFQGKPACAEIPLGKGVCGTAVVKGETLIVPDVHAFAGHIACDAASRSEIVVPLMQNARPRGVLDIDSPVLNRFDEEDAQFPAKNSFPSLIRFFPYYKFPSRLREFYDTKNAPFQARL